MHLQIISFQIQGSPFWITLFIGIVLDSNDKVDTSHGTHPI